MRFFRINCIKCVLFFAFSCCLASCSTGTLKELLGLEKSEPVGDISNISTATSLSVPRLLRLPERNENSQSNARDNVHSTMGKK